MTAMSHEDNEDRRGAVTRLLQASPTEEPRWAEELLPLIYEELRALARARMAREGVGHTIQATALVHDAYLRLVGDADPGWNGRIVNLRYFVGFTAQETAEALGLSLGTIEREWRFIKVWLQDELARGSERPQGPGV